MADGRSGHTEPSCCFCHGITATDGIEGFQPGKRRGSDLPQAFLPRTLPQADGTGVEFPPESATYTKRRQY